MTASLMIHSDRPRLEGWRYLWLKEVTGFDPRVHCARCLVGSYDRAVGLAAPVNDMITLRGHVGAILYLCGVAWPYRWENNLHLAVEVTGDPCDIASAVAYNGDEFTVAGAARVPFTDGAARLQFSGRAKSYLTCRNFQFGADLSARGLISRGAPGPAS